ncbi:MAG: HEAT repeat domain-containing protein [Zetaproteobacteria bacterium]|nr:HEAT repeat domain-containing protein [Zetaproteobacteria bacterium]
MIEDFFAASLSAQILGLLMVGWTALVLVIMMVMLLPQGWLDQRSTRSGRMMAGWKDDWMKLVDRPVGSMAGAEDLLSPLNSSAVAAVAIQAWCEIFPLLSSAHQAALREEARRLQLGNYARSMASSDQKRDNILSCCFFGYMGDEAAIPLLDEHLHSHDGKVSLLAADALIKIDQQSALMALAPLIFKEPKWAVDQCAALLQSFDSELLSYVLTDSIRQAEEAQRPNLIKYLIFSNRDVVTEFVEEILQARGDDETIIASLTLLSQMGQQKSAALVRSFLDHGSWVVRTMAVRALGVVGSVDDISIIASMMFDRQRWVRYRAAEALVALPGVDEDELELLYQMGDDFFRDTLRQAMAAKHLQGA